jgi:hypothetical protein
MAETAAVAGRRRRAHPLCPRKEFAVKLFLGTVVALALTASLFDGGAVAQAPKKSGGKKVLQGHSLVSREKLAKLPDGKHHVHTSKRGHKFHVHAKGGKVAGMSVLDSKGKQHKLKHRVVRRPAGGSPVALDGEPLSPEELALLEHATPLSPEEAALLEDADGALGDPFTVQAGVQVFVIFTFTPPPPPIPPPTPPPVILIVFPGSSVSIIIL